jgi:hypothetical protein
MELRKLQRATGLDTMEEHGPAGTKWPSGEGATVGDAGSTRDQWEPLDGMGAHRSRLVTAADSGGRR